MADISAKSVMELRKKIGASMMECKKALVETNGDEEKAIQILKEKGAAKAEKKSDRETAEGTALFSGNAYVKLLCETDFVARNNDFVAFAKQIADTVNEKGIDAGQAFFDANKADKIIALGENLVLAEIGTIEGEIFSGYVHSNGKIAALVALSGGSEELAKDIGMHIVGMSPSVLSYTDIDPVEADKETAGRIAAIEKDNIERERLGKHLLNIPKFISQSQITDEMMDQITEDIKAELKAEGKPEKIWDKIMPGKIQRFISDNTSFDKEQALLSQDFVKDASKTIEALLQENSATVIAFKRLAV